MCMFLTVMYAGFAGLTFAYSKSVMEELDEDERTTDFGHRPSQITSSHHHPFGYNNGYIGERFDIRRNAPGGGFVSAPPDKGII